MRRCGARADRGCRRWCVEGPGHGAPSKAPRIRRSSVSWPRIPGSPVATSGSWPRDRTAETGHDRGPRRGDGRCPFARAARSGWSSDARCGLAMSQGDWLSRLERTVHIREVTGSNPVSPTNPDEGEIPPDPRAAEVEDPDWTATTVGVALRDELALLPQPARCRDARGGGPRDRRAMRTR